MLYSQYKMSVYWQQFPLIHNPLHVAKSGKAILVECRNVFDMHQHNVWIPTSQCTIVTNDVMINTNYYLISDWFVTKLRTDGIIIRFDETPHKAKIEMIHTVERAQKLVTRTRSDLERVRNKYNSDKVKYSDVGTMNQLAAAEAAHEEALGALRIAQAVAGQ